MTGARRQQKAKVRRVVPAMAAVAALLAATGGLMPAGAATTGLIVTDTLTGIALSGFDPVAYFTDRIPRLGEGGHELTHGGVVWRFRNDGNRAAFARDPAVYAPRFGGYDPLGLARGVAVPGHPLIWLIVRDRLYLFSTVESRNRFAGEAEHSIAAAERRWPEVERTLVP
jgi:hypothetical protein